MNGTELQKVHGSFWLIALFSLLWNAGGAANLATQMAMGAEMYPKLSEGQLALIKERPIWATAGFALAMIAGLLGSLLLLLRRALSLKLFILSLIGVLVVMAHGAMVIVSGVSFTTTEIVMYFIGQTLLGLFLVWYTKFAIGRDWLR